MFFEAIHDPFDPHCLECQQGRGVSRAPRRSLKMILLRQVFSGLPGVTAVSENVR